MVGRNLVYGTWSWKVIKLTPWLWIGRGRTKKIKDSGDIDDVSSEYGWSAVIDGCGYTRFCGAEMKPFCLLYLEVTILASDTLKYSWLWLAWWDMQECKTLNF